LLQGLMANDASIAHFKSLLSSTNWDPVLKIQNPDIVYNSFNQMFQKHYNKAFPKILKIIKEKTFQNPWITPGIIKSSKKNNVYMKN